MNYSKEEVVQYTQEEDVKFIRLAFCDVFGNPKNISIMPDELPRAFAYGVAFDPSAITGFGTAQGELVLHPEPETLMPLPWRPEHGSVVQMFCSVTDRSGAPFVCDTRAILKKAVDQAARAGVQFSFGSVQKFYLLLLDENGKPTPVPCDDAGYMDIAPEDKGENVRREICLTLEQMGIRPARSHHEEGPGQNGIEIRCADALTAADQAMTFRRAAKTVAFRNGMAAVFSPKPFDGRPGNDFFIRMTPSGDAQALRAMIAGVKARCPEMTAFFNPTEESYKRIADAKSDLFSEKCPALVRVCGAENAAPYALFRSPDPTANPYLAFALLIAAGLEGMQKGLILDAPEETAPLFSFAGLPERAKEAKVLAAQSAFIRAHIPPEILAILCGAQQ